MHRSIIHLDMNAFFASVEQQATPELQGKPIAVVGASHRTVITTASYEARAFGVKTGMAIWEGKRVCPELIIVVGDNRKYTYTSTKINEIFRSSRLNRPNRHIWPFVPKRSFSLPVRSATPGSRNRATTAR